jgi:predicted nuclease of predicted toxin-antitoxin system
MKFLVDAHLPTARCIRIAMPWKLLLIRTGNARTRDLKALLKIHFDEIIDLLEENSLVEFHGHSVHVVA